MTLDKAGAAQKANLIDFAYNMFEGAPMNPKPAVSKDILQAGYQFLYYLNGTDPDGTVRFYGYIAKSTTGAGAYALIIRGTQTPAEWLADFTAIPVPFSANPNAGTVALGFDRIYASFQYIDTSGNAHTLAAVVAALAASPGGITEFLVLGHSLGAALATLAAADLTTNNLSNVQKSVVVYTYASPLVGLLDFVFSFHNAVEESYRIWNALDIVPYLPPFPYLHVSGLGDGLVQNEQQLQELVFNPGCEHTLSSYQWLLDPASYPLSTGCQQQQAAAALLTTSPAHTPAMRAQGLSRMAKAMAGH